ncbi:unnamed protein product [Orchesella dallaii]|uniref:TPX2 C-terminal domain-containing protein n=1 Tax=Orchesella dallaii TaxID=48710 RepID=A0ABP1QEQ4_9HEXA
MAESQQQIDHYDFINAPQFVDFDDLQSQDDPDADKFFETHREEDDFLIPLDVDCISPTVQLLDEQNVHYSNEANKAAMAAGLEDVKIEYYASPQQSTGLSQPSSANKKSTSSSTYGTPLGGSVLTTSFFTPTGGEDKENVTPVSEKCSTIKKSDGKFASPNEIKEERNNRGILAERALEGIQSLSLDSPLTIKSAKKIESNTIPTQSLMSQLDQLVIVSSDEDDILDDLTYSDSGNIALPQANEFLVQQTESESNYSTFSLQKTTFLDISESGTDKENGDVKKDSSADVGDVTVVADPSKSPGKQETVSDESDLESDGFGSTSVELGAHVRNILKKLDAELNLEDDNLGDEDGPRYSILVAPSVGQQVHWSAGDTDTHQIIANTADERELNVSYDVEEVFNDQLGTHKSIEEGPISDMDLFDTSSVSTISIINRRASSVGDLIQALEIQPKERNFQTFGYNPRAGITIPKTPDVPNSRESERNTKNNRDRDSGKSSGYFFEVEVSQPTHSKSVRRVSSCGDLIKLQQKAKANSQLPSVRRGLTIPRTPDTAKRVSKRNASDKSTASSLQASKHIVPPRHNIKTLPTVAERLAAAQNRKPMKANHYVSMAEAMIKYQKNTPDRFRSLPRGQVPEKRAASNDSRKRASPSPGWTPEIATTSRSRADSYTERKEHVKPTTSKAAQNCSVLPKRVDLKPTVPRPFNLSSGHRPKPVAVTQKNEDVVDFKFKARPAPKILHETVVVNKPKLHKVTQPMSPHFASDDRLRERQQKRANSVPKSPETKQVKPAVHGQRTCRIPTINTSIQRGHVDEHKTTVVQPFSTSFEARQNETLRRKEEKVRQELEAQKVREFHANPVPKFTTKLPKKKPVESTSVEPFNLKSDERGAAYQEAFKKKLEEEEQHLKEQAVFHAQPADVIYKPPFEPERPARVIETHELNLATEKRAAEREHFDEQIKEKEREEEERKREEQARMEELQRQDDIERRRQLVHKAQPFKAPKPFQLKASSKPLTVPQSPAFQALPSDRRIKPQSP